MSTLRKILAVHTIVGVGIETTKSFRASRGRIEIEDLGPILLVKVFPPTSLPMKGTVVHQYRVPWSNVAFVEDYPPEPAKE